MSDLVRLTTQFEGAPLHTLEWDGRPCWLALEVGRALGYSEGGRRLSRSIRDQEWGAVEVQDFLVVRGEQLAGIKARLAELGTDCATSGRRAPGLTLLFESGVYIACLKSRSEVGNRLRRFLADEVLPQLARTGEYSQAVDTRRLVEAHPAPAPAVVAAPVPEELVLRRQELTLRAIELASKLADFPLPVKQELAQRALRTVLGEALTAYLPVTDPYPHTLTSIGEHLGISAIRVGRLARECGVWDDPDCRQIRLVKRAHNAGQAEQRFFNDRGRDRIREAWMAECIRGRSADAAAGGAA